MLIGLYAELNLCSEPGGFGAPFAIDSSVIDRWPSTWEKTDYIVLISETKTKI